MPDFWLIVAIVLAVFGLAFQQLRERLINIQWQVEEINRKLGRVGMDDD